MRHLTDLEIKALQDNESQKSLPKTPEQIEAIYRTGTNILVSASAGSGKTFVMTERIINLILNGISVKNLFVSTFTNKAATELKTRLDKKIRETRNNVDDRKKRHLLTTALQELQYADIGTMDSFTLKFLKEHFYLKNIDPSFRLLVDKTEQDVIKQELFDKLVEESLAGKGVISRERFIRVMENFSTDRKITPFYTVLDKINTFADSLENPLNWLQDTFMTGFSKYQKYTELPDRFTDGLQESLSDIYRILEANLASGLITGKAKIANTQEFLGNYDYLSSCLKEKKFKDFLTLYRELKFQFVPNANNKDNRDEGVELQKKEIKALITTNKERLDAFVESIKHQEIIENYHDLAKELTSDLQEIALVFYQAYHNYKLEHGMLDYADITHLTIEILQENDTLRTVYQTQYFEVMIDEYQDTNHLQEGMLNLLSNGHNKFMVGDVKQSIYGFRLADPALFMAKYESYQREDSDGVLIRLKENFRSRPEVIQFTNEIFKRLMDKNIGEMVYGEAESLVVGNTAYQTDTSDSLTAELLIYQDQKAKPDDENSLTSDELVVTAQEILKLVKSGVNYKDIVILVRSKTNNSEIERVLQSYNIPVVLDEGKMTYLQAMEVLVMLDVLRAIDNPLFDISFVSLLKSPLVNFDENDLSIISLQASNDVSFYEKLQLSIAKTGLKQELIPQQLFLKLTAFMTRFDRWTKLSRQDSLYSLIWHIYRDTHYYDYVGGMINGQLRQANLTALADRAADYETSGYKGLFQFINMIDNFITSNNDLTSVNIALPTDSVRVMTIHKSKGLEFPYVFILNFNKKFNTKELSGDLILSRKNGAGIQFTADFKDEIDTEFPYARVKMTTLPHLANSLEKEYQSLAEEMRMLYVAFTRAVNKIYMIAKIDAAKIDDAGQFIPYQTVSFDQAGLLETSIRKSSQGYLHWILGIYQAMTVKTSLGLKVRLVSDEALQDMSIVDEAPMTSFETLLTASQSFDHVMDTIEDVKKAKNILESTDQLNQKYQAGIQLPTVQTPSQIKKRYEQLLPESDVVINTHHKYSKFEFFQTDNKVSATELGTAVHELMQSIDFTNVSRETLKQTISRLSVKEAVKQKIDIDKILTLFTTSFGEFMVANADKMTREAPFSMLKTDEASGEQYVIRGIIDGFIKCDDKIVLFDYKTDHFTTLDKMKQICSQYHMQMSLYAESLCAAFKVDRVEKYLILLGGPEKVFIEAI